jgi:hypothetical protein
VVAPGTRSIAWSWRRRRTQPYLLTDAKTDGAVRAVYPCTVASLLTSKLVTACTWRAMDGASSLLISSFLHPKIRSFNFSLSLLPSVQALASCAQYPLWLNHWRPAVLRTISARGEAHERCMPPLSIGRPYCICFRDTSLFCLINRAFKLLPDGALKTGGPPPPILPMIKFPRTRTEIFFPRFLHCLFWGKRKTVKQL